VLVFEKGMVGKICSKGQIPSPFFDREGINNGAANRQLGADLGKD